MSLCIEQKYIVSFVNSIDPNKPVHPHILFKIYNFHRVLTQVCSKNPSTCVDYDKTEQMDKMIWSCTVQKWQLVPFLIHGLIFPLIQSGSDQCSVIYFHVTYHSEAAIGKCLNNEIHLFAHNIQHRPPVATRDVNLEVISSDPSTANILSDVWQRSIWHSLFFIRISCETTTSGFEILWQQNWCRKRGNTWIGEQVSVIWLKKCYTFALDPNQTIMKQVPQTYLKTPR